MFGSGWYLCGGSVRADLAGYYLGVDACNTVLEVLLFAAAMNLGQSWSTILTLFGCKLAVLHTVDPLPLFDRLD